MGVTRAGSWCATALSWSSARLVSDCALCGSASATASSAWRAASISAWAWASRACSADNSAHSPSAGHSLSSSANCQASRSRSRSISSPRDCACAKASAAALRAAKSATSAPVFKPAWVSTSSRVAAARVRLCQACWPWMSSRWSATSRSCVTVAALPLIQARLLPWASMLRLSSKPGSALAKPALSSQPMSAGGVSNSALTSARAAPSRTTPASPLAPSASCSASIKIDLPAPVSPVSTEKPAWKSSSSAGTITKSRKASRRSTSELQGRARTTQRLGARHHTTPSYQRNLRRSVA